MLRSDIRLSPSGIRYASLEANKISLEPQGFNITIAHAIISLRRSRNITLAFSADLCYNRANRKPPSEREGDGMLSSQVQHFFETKSKGEM